MKKKRIVQIEGIYPNFFDHLRISKPYINHLPYDGLLEAIFDSGWSSGQNVVPYLNQSKWETEYIISNCEILQRKWAAERGLPQSLTLDEILYFQLQDFSPDVVYLSDIPSFKFELVRALSRKPFVIGWLATSIADYVDWKSIDLVLSGISTIRSTVIAKGAKAAEKFMSGCPSHRGLKRSLGDGKKGDVAFCGSFFGGLHEERAVLIHEAFCRTSTGFIDIYTSNRFKTKPEAKINFEEPVYGSQVVSTYSKYPIVFDMRAKFNLEGERVFSRDTSNMRIFEATKAGSFLLTEACTNLEEYFIPGKEIETFASFEELLSKLDFYCDPKNSRTREQIAFEGYNRSVASHSIEARANWFEKILMKYFSSC